VLNDLPATQAKHTQVNMYTADVYSTAEMGPDK